MKHLKVSEKLCVCVFLGGTPPKWVGFPHGFLSNHKQHKFAHKKTGPYVAVFAVSPQSPALERADPLPRHGGELSGCFVAQGRNLIASRRSGRSPHSKKNGVSQTRNRFICFWMSQQMVRLPCLPHHCTITHISKEGLGPNGSRQLNILEDPHEGLLSTSFDPRNCSCLDMGFLKIRVPVTWLVYLWFRLKHQLF